MTNKTFPTAIGEWTLGQHDDGSPHAYNNSKSRQTSAIVCLNVQDGTQIMEVEVYHRPYEYAEYAYIPITVLKAWIAEYERLYGEVP